jgi:hypothetical protein
MPLSSAFIPYIKGIFENYKCIRNHITLAQSSKQNIGMRILLMKIKPKIKHNIRQCSHHILCECGRSHVGEIKGLTLSQAL